MKQQAIGIDQFLNTLVPAANPATGKLDWSDSWADETFSSRCWRYGRDRGGKWEAARQFIDTLFFFDRQHCFSSYISERERLQAPPELRNTP